MNPFPAQSGLHTCNLTFHNVMSCNLLMLVTYSEISEKALWGQLNVLLVHRSPLNSGLKDNFIITLMTSQAWNQSARNRRDLVTISYFSTRENFTLSTSSPGLHNLPFICKSLWYRNQFSVHFYLNFTFRKHHISSSAVY